MTGALLLWVILGGPAAAQDNGAGDQKAKEWFVNGQVLYQEGRYRDALVAFEAAYRMSSRPNVLRSIAYCYENLGELGNAVDVLYRYRGLANSSKIPEIDRHIQRLEQRLEDRLEAAAVPPPIEPEPEPEPEPEARPPSREVAPRQQWVVQKGQVVLYSVAGAAFVTGGTFAIQASSARASAARLCSTDDAVYCPRSAAKHINDDWFYSLGADTSFAVGGAAVVGATLWMLIDNSRATGISVVPMANGVGLVGRF